MWPPDITVELWYDDAWHDITGDVQLQQDIVITRGRRDEGTTADAGTAVLQLNNRHGKYSWRNPMSPLYGKIGRNTPLRVRVGDVPEPGDVLLADTFDRTETDGWGQADSGQTWEIYDLDVSTPAGDYSVSGGAGRLAQTVAEIGPASVRAVRADGLQATDVDITVTITMPTTAESWDGTTGAYAGVLLRLNPATDTFVLPAVRFAPASGLPAGQGLRVATDIIVLVDDVQRQVTLSQTVPDLTYTPGQALRMRVLAVGPELRMRVWPADETEPAIWHAQSWTDQVTEPGEIGVFAQTTAEDTSVPYEMEFRDLAVREPAEDTGTVRFVGEVVSWPPRWDVSGHASWVSITASGLLRRMRQGSSPLQSAMRRHITGLRPVGYWPMEEGILGRNIGAAAGGQPLRVGGIAFQEARDVLGSGPLPVLTAGTPTTGEAPFMRATRSVPAVATRSWSVTMLVRMPTVDNWPTDEQQLLRWFTSGTARQWIVTAGTIGGNSALRLRMLDSEDNQLGNVVASHQAAVAGGGPELAGVWRVLEIYAIQDGSSIQFRFDWVPLDGSSNWGNGNSYSGSVGAFQRISTTFGTELEGVAIGHLAAWGVGFTNAYYDLDQTFLHSTDGFSGEAARQRARRVAGDEGVPVLITGPAATPMGPQPDSDVMSTLRQVADADLGILHETRDALALALRARTTLYNQVPKLVLDYSRGELSPPLEPIDDDQRLRNDITVSRDRGSSARAVADSGPLSVEPPPAGVGRYDTSATINVVDDDLLGAHAEMLLHIGTTDEIRWPVITLNLANSRVRPLIPDILRLAEGDRVVVLNPPADVPPEDVDQLVESTEERLGAFTWEMRLTGGPARAWTGGEVAPDDLEEQRAPGHVDTSGSELTAAAGEDDTVLWVQATAGEDWVVTGSEESAPGDVPLDITIGGERITVHHIGPAQTGPMVGAGDDDGTPGTDHIAPSVTAGVAGLLVCCWGSFAEAGTYTVPAGMTAGGQHTGTYATGLLAYEAVGAGATGTRTATHAPADAWGAVTVAVAGATLLDLQSGISSGTVTLTTSVAAAPGQWLLAVQAWDWDPADDMAGPDGTGWELIASSGPSSGDVSRVQAWARQVTAAGTQQVDLPIGTSVDDNICWLLLLDGIEEGTGQPFTVSRSINGVIKPHLAGADVRLSDPATVVL